MGAFTSWRSRHQLDLSSQGDLARLHRLTVCSRWALALVLWLTIGTLSLWTLRRDFALLVEHFTWVAVRYGLIHNPLAGLGLGLCVGMTTATLVWQTRNILLGLPHREQQRLEQQLCHIRKRGPTHPLWKWIYGHEPVP